MSLSEILARETRNTQITSAAGIPVISVPIGLSNEIKDTPPLPVGMDIAGKSFDDRFLLSLALKLEKNKFVRHLTPVIYR